MTDSTDDVDWYDGPQQDYECNQCALLRAERDALEKDAAIGCVVWRFIDRMTDVCEQDTADEILSEFVVAVRPLIDAALAAQENSRASQTLKTE